MSSSEKFCLRWNDFESNISIAFREIREEKDFLDCTLSCGSRQIQAHKLILSACSPFFRSVLRQNPHQHPLLYLKGVQFTDLQAVLNFMYHGEVNVAQEDLNSFLAVAEDLQVKGLTQGNSKDNNTSTKLKSDHIQNSIKVSESTSRSIKEDTRESVAGKRPRIAVAAPSNIHKYQEDDDIQEVMPVVKQEPSTTVVESTPVQQYGRDQVAVFQPASEPVTFQENAVAQIDESYGEENYDYDGYQMEDGYDNPSNTGMGQNSGEASFFLMLCG